MSSESKSVDMASCMVVRQYVCCNEFEKEGLQYFGRVLYPVRSGPPAFMRHESISQHGPHSLHFIMLAFFLDLRQCKPAGIEMM